MTHMPPKDEFEAPATDGALARKIGERRETLFRWTVIALFLVALIGAWVLWRDMSAAPAQAASAPPPVTVATPLERNVTEWDDYVGRFAPSKAVDIRPRVSGALTQIRFHDGDVVQKGQLLFVIDPRPFTAALAEAQADVGKARTALALAQADLGRATRLVADDAVAAEEVDSLRAQVRSAEANLAAAQARVRARALDVEFTQVRAPISGRISNRRVDVGNLVAGGDGSSATLLTTIYALDPIYFTFDASEALYLKAQRARAAGDHAPEQVQIRLQDEDQYRWHGTVDFTDNGLDPTSGTISARAVVSNPDYFLSPGMFGNMRRASAGSDMALLVPDEAVQTDQARKIVLTVGKDGKVAAKPVEVGAVVRGLRIIRSGLSPDDRVVISGMQNAMPGSPVSASKGKIMPEPLTQPVADQGPDSLPASEATFAAR